jgi:hypothetical protein
VACAVCVPCDAVCASALDANNEHAAIRLTDSATETAHFPLCIFTPAHTR